MRQVHISQVGKTLNWSLLKVKRQPYSEAIETRTRTPDGAHIYKSVRVFAVSVSSFTCGAMRDLALNDRYTMS